MRSWEELEAGEQVYAPMLSLPWMGTLALHNAPNSFPLRSHFFDFSQIRARPFSGTLHVDPNTLALLPHGGSFDISPLSSSCPFGAIEVHAPFQMISL